MSSDDIGSRVAKGAAFVTMARFAGRILGFVNTLILAKLLVPEDFGVVAIGILMQQLLQNISDIGVAQAVIKYRQGGREQVDTLFTLSFIRGLIVAGIMMIAAPVAGAFYGDPRITIIFLSLGGISYIQALMNPRFYEFERDLDFSREALVTLLVKVISVCVSITIALIFRSYIAILMGVATGVLIQVVASYALKPYRPRFSFAHFRQLIGFSGWLTGVSALVAMNNKTEPLILGKIIGLDMTGSFYVGEQVASMATMEIATPISRAVYPGLSILQDDMQKMRAAYLQGSEALAAISMPAAVGVALVAPDLVNVMLRKEWANATPVIQVFAPFLGLVSIYMATQGLAMARGMTKEVFFRELIYFCFKTPLFIAGAIFYGLPGALAAAAINGIAYTGLQARLYARISGGPFWEPLWRARRSFIALLAMLVYFWGVQPMFGFLMDAPSWVRLLVNIPLAASCFIAALYGLWRVENCPDGIEKSALKMAKQAMAALLRARG